MNYHIIQNPEDAALLMATEEYQEKVTTSPFLYLTLDLPTTPLFQVSPAAHINLIVCKYPFTFWD